MKRTFCLIVAIHIAIVMVAQTLQGKVSTSNGEPVEAATIVVQSMDSVVVGACITDSCGTFSLESVCFPYILIVRHMAHHPYVVKDSVLNISVTLDALAYELNEVSVKGRLSMRVNESGALQYNGKMLAENRPVRNALDMLDEIPTLQKTGSKYTIIGATSFCILINGKKSGMSEDQIQSYLSSLPPERVASIDVYYNTPSLFGVRGASVNIVLAKSRYNGIKTKGNINGGLTQATHAGANSGINLSITASKLSANIGYSGVYHDMTKMLDLHTDHNLEGRIYNILQKDKSRVKSFANNLFADANITLNEGSSLTLSYVLQQTYPKVCSSAISLFDDIPNQSDTQTRTTTWLHDFEASYCFKNLEIGANATFYNEEEEQKLLDSYDNSLDGNYKQRSTKICVYLDDRVDLWGGHVDFGIRGNLSSTTNDKDFFSAKGFNGESFRFEQKELSGKAYVGYRHPISKKGFYNVSFEGEYFQSSFSKNSAKNTPLWEQWQLYPSFTLVYRFRPTRIIQVTLNSEKYYPSYWTTAANRTYINSYCVSDGNTELMPYIKYNCNLNYIIKSKYIFGLFAETSPNHFIQSMVLSKSELHAIYRFFNLDSDYRYGLMTILPINWNNKFKSQLTVMAFDLHQSGSIDNGLSFSKNKITSVIRLNNNFSLLNKKLNLELSGWYQFPAIQGYYNVQEMYSISAGATWLTPFDGFSITFKGEDIFDTYRMKTKCNFEKMRYDFCNNVDRQSFSLTFRYTFNGYKDREKKSVDDSRFGL